MDSFGDHLQDALGANYRLDRELTGGGMSRVFVALDKPLGRNVVVKVLPPELAAGVNRERFRREIQVAAQLQHPHIVPLLAAGEQGDLLWYTMPYIEGESLRAALERKKSFTVREVVRVLHDIVDALSFAHARGVIHRDIKPANILTQGSHALVTDFGVAKALSAAMPLTGMTSTGVAIGTPAYMAPEQLAGDPNADHRIDLYAAGLLAYELLSGESPFTGPSPRETLTAQLTHNPKPLHELSGNVPRTVSALIMRLLAKDPANRPATADEVLHELDSLTMPVGISPTPVETPVPRTRRTRNVAAVFLVIAVAAVATAVGRNWNARHSKLAPPPVPPSPATIDSAVRRSLGPLGQAPSPPGSAPSVAAPQAVPKQALTRAESLAIAEAVRKKMAAAQARDSAARARIARETERRMLDSIIAANSGGASAPLLTARRILVVEPREVRGWPEAQLLGRAVSDSLQRMLGGRKRQFIIVSPDSVRAEVARTRNPTDLSRALNADLIASIQLVALPRDSATLLLNVFDLGAIPQFQRRTAAGMPTAKALVLGNLDALLLSTLTYLEEMSRAPRQPTK
jgi:serine/threonine protein kinase